MIASFIAAVIAVKWLVSYIKTHDFTYFGIYRIILSIFFFLFWVWVYGRFNLRHGKIKTMVFDPAYWL